MSEKPKSPKFAAINTAYLVNRSFACDQYEDVGKEAGPDTGEDVFLEYGIRESECQILTFTISPEELQILNDALALADMDMDRLWAALISSRSRYRDLLSVLNQVKQMRLKEQEQQN